MAFILKSTKLIHCLIECSRPRAVTSTGKNIFFSMFSRSPVLPKGALRSVVSLAAEEQNSSFGVDQLFLRLNEDIRSRKVFLETAREVFDAVKQKGEITEPQLMLLLKCCSEVSFMSSSKERIQFAEEILKAAVDLGVELNVNHYNALLSVFLENNHKFSPSEFLAELQEKGIEPNLVTQRRFLKAFCQKGDIEGAMSILEKMKELNFPLSEEDFNALIQCHCEMGEFHKAHDILKVMEDREIECTGKTYLNLLCGYAKHGKIEELMDLLEKLPSKDIYLSCSDFLEIIYTLAVNNFTDHIDKVLQKFNNDYERAKSTNVVIQRLLHQRMDSLAFKLFEYLEDNRNLHYVLSRSKFILRHFALYRNPKKTLSVCQELEEKGWAKSAASFALGQIYLYKDQNFCFEFLRIMMQRNINVRSHYFWPLLIKASKEKDNSKMLDILNIIPQPLLTSCQYTTTRIVFPNFKFSENWEADNDILVKAGLPQRWLSVCFIEKLLMEDKFEDVERLVSLFPVDMERYNHIFNILIDYVQVHPELVERLVNIVYCLAHDFKLRFNRVSQEEEGDEESTSEVFPESSNKNIFDIFLAVFMKLLRDEKVFEQVLQKMLERKLGISAEGASTIISSQKVSNLDDLVKKLSDRELQMVYDDNLLKLKAQDSKRSKSSVQFKHYNENDDINVEKLQEQLAEDGSFFKTLHFVRNMIRIKRYEDALSLARTFSQSKDELYHSKKRGLYSAVVRELQSVGQYDLAEKAFRLGVDMGIFPESDYVLYVISLIERGESSLAVEKYCAHLERTKNSARCMEFLASLVSRGREDDLRRIMAPLINLIGKNLFMTFLVLAFTENGNFSKAKQLLETKRFKFLNQQFCHYCKIRSRLGTSAELENLLKVVKDSEFVDRVPLYKLLIKKYAKERNIEKVKKLWLLIEEDDISDFVFLEKMRELMDEPSVEALKDIARAFQANMEMRTTELKSEREQQL